jgi:hypothetical protein
MNNTLKKIKNLLDSFNESFEVDVNIEEDNDENVVRQLKITNLKGDRSEFVSELFTIFNSIISNVSDEHELIYNEEKGLVIAKKVVKVDYIIEEDNNKEEPPKTQNNTTQDNKGDKGKSKEDQGNNE